MCEEQMMAKAIGFRERGEKRSIGAPFDIRSEACRLCGACMYICPVCSLSCVYNDPEIAICGGCANISSPCLEKEKFDDMMCYMDPCLACEIPKENLKGE
jgi:coenzyme F420 hydrogenase subunit beta